MATEEHRHTQRNNYYDFGILETAEQLSGIHAIAYRRLDAGQTFYVFRHDDYFPVLFTIHYLLLTFCFCVTL
jgi:hypothetical protein